MLTVYTQGGTLSDQFFPEECQDVITGTPYCQNGLANPSGGVADAYISRFDISDLLSIDDKSIDFKSINIYPNPCDYDLTISFDEVIFGNIEIKIYNIIGEQIYFENKSIINKEITINTNNFINGIYMLVIETNNSIFKNKFIKTK